MKLFKTICYSKKNKVYEVCWTDECMGADGILIGPFCLENCSEITENNAYDIYLSDEFINCDGSLKEENWGNVMDDVTTNCANEIETFVYDCVVNKGIGYLLMKDNVTVGYAIERPMTPKEFVIENSIDMCGEVTLKINHLPCLCGRNETIRKSAEGILSALVSKINETFKDDGINFSLGEFDIVSHL